MLTTVLIGNSNTYIRHGLMVTPRGYENKYDVTCGSTPHHGEQRGRSLSSGLDGWLTELRREIEEHGRSITDLAREQRLPADYLAAALSAAPTTQQEETTE